MGQFFFAHRLRETDQLGDGSVNNIGRSCRYTECSPAFDLLRILTALVVSPIFLRVSPFLYSPLHTVANAN